MERLGNFSGEAVRRFLPLLASCLCSSTLAGPNEPLNFELHPSQFHAYQSDPQKELVLTLIVRNPLDKPVPLSCVGVSQPVLRRFTEVQDGKSVLRDEFIGELSPVEGAPVCSRAGEVLTLPAHTVWRYSRNVGVQKVGAQVHYRAAWNVSLRSGFGWLNSTETTMALVVPQSRPVPTPDQAAYLAALRESGAQVYEAGHGDRLSFGFVDEAAKQRFLNQLRKRGLDASKIDIEVSPPVRFGPVPNVPHTAKVAVSRTAKGFEFTLKLTNTAKTPLTVHNRTCEPHAIERVSDSVVVQQQGNGPCPAVATAPTTLKPGESVTRRVIWDGKDSSRHTVSPGRYRAHLGLGQFSAYADFEVR